MRFLALPAATLATPATAHVGHLGETAGHDHWVAGAAIGVAIGLSLWSAWKGRKSEEPAEESESEDDAEPQEA